MRINLSNDKLFSVGEISKMLGVTTATVRNWIYAEKLQAIKVSHVYRIPEQELKHFIKESSYDGSQIELS